MAQIPTGILFVVVMFVIILAMFIVYTVRAGDVAKQIGLVDSPFFQGGYTSVVDLEDVKVTIGGTDVTSEKYDKADGASLNFQVSLKISLSPHASVICDEGWTVTGQYCEKDGVKEPGYRNLDVTFTGVEIINGKELFTGKKIDLDKLEIGEVRDISSGDISLVSSYNSGPVNIRIVALNDDSPVILETAYGMFYVT